MVIWYNSYNLILRINIWWTIRNDGGMPQTMEKLQYKRVFIEIKEERHDGYDNIETAQAE